MTDCLPIVEDALRVAPNDARVLDVGAGVGRHALLFARRGMSVDAVDIAPEYVAEVVRCAASEQLPVRACVLDVAKTNPQFTDYRVVLFTMVLHHLTYCRAEALLDLARMQAHAGALHVVAAVTEEGDFATGERHDYFYANEDRLQRMYEHDGWETLSVRVAVHEMRQRHADGRPMTNKVVSLLARKPEEKLRP